ncbi:flagellar hook capping FlgD N-terminal domain-containing protein [Fuchsiella alkaliacetigena]|uniref:flagellar hook capping FlgD N-terminal domain-containing protein n=1 Tax=Fuchsiella alkaliacetigena TaxID=957042 RepID=UPI00200B4986|nr:flagellar hook capping FlgD N-terminal domain-containing protein [Fuchsiella alkaliacetigena]MCK8823548.1 hypothetical protein [Fuchsiella alkaliacetigena]
MQVGSTAETGDTVNPPPPGQSGGIVEAPGDTYTGEPTEVESESSELGKDDFLKLLVTQMQYQDPLEPMDNKEFIAQTAQFTSLEQMTNMNESMNKFLEMQELSQLGGLIDRKATVLSSDGEEITGVVERIKMDDGEAKLVIEGQEFDIGSLKEVIGTAGEIEDEQWIDEEYIEKVNQLIEDGVLSQEEVEEVEEMIMEEDAEGIKEIVGDYYE